MKSQRELIIENFVQWLITLAYVILCVLFIKDGDYLLAAVFAALAGVSWKLLGDMKKV